MSSSSTPTAETTTTVPIPSTSITSFDSPDKPPQPQRSPSISNPILTSDSSTKARLLSLQTQLSLPSTPQSSQLSSPSSSSTKGLRRMGSVKKQPFFMNLRIQLIDQLKSLDTRLETQVQLTNEIQEFFKKRAEVEMETSRALEKLAKNLNTRHKEIKAKRDSSSATSTLTAGNPLSTPLLSSSLSQSLSQAQNQSLQPWTVFNSQSSLSVCWQQLINDTKIQSQNHAILADIYSTEVTQRLQFVSEDLQRIYKQCREIGLEAHEELLKVLHELHTSMKTYHTYQTDTRIAEAKLKLVEAQRSKLEQQIPKEKLEKSKKMKLVEKEVQKRMHKFTDARFKSQKAKNEYILCMDAANAAVQKYFMEDLSDLIDCMDLGFYECVTRSLNMYVSSQDQIRKSLQQNMENMSKCISSLDARLDKQKFLESHNTVFALPKKFEFVGPTYPSNKNTASIAEEDFTPDPPEIETSGFIRQELEQRLFQLHKRLETLRMESDELWKTLETAENSLLEMITAKDYDTCAFFIERVNRVTTASSEGATKIRNDKQETDEFHLNKFRDYMLTMNRISRLQSKYEHIRRTLKSTDPTGALPPTTGVGSSASTSAAAIAASTRQYNRRKRIGQIQKFTNTRLFGGSIEEYLEKTNQEIPLVMKSCIRVINLYGLQHQGIFRVSGSQVEINNFKEAFEKGEDPLADVNDASDINSVAGVFKLYLRELREPLFPICYFEQFMELAQLDSNQIFISRMRDLVKSLPRAVFIVLRYLFAFLNHLSEYSDENMMDPYNLAICFGPTLVPVPEDKDQVQYQNLVNELIKNVICFHDEIFVDINDGVYYEKYISTNEEPGGGDDAGGGEPGSKHGIGESSPVLKKSLSCVGGGGGTRTGHSREDSSCSSVTSAGRCEDGRISVMSEEAKNNIDKKSAPTSPTISTSPLPNPPNSPIIKETVILNDDLDEDDDDELEAGVSLSIFQKKSEFLEAIAQFDFSARSTRELSLKKGETLVLYAQVSSDWWKGANRRGDEGLIPDKYILLKIRDEDMPQQPQIQPLPPQQHTATTPSSTHTVPPPLATPPQNNNPPSSDASIISQQQQQQPIPKASNRSRTSSDSLLTTPVQKSLQNNSSGSTTGENNMMHTRSFSVSDDRASSAITNNKVHHQQNGVASNKESSEKSENGRKPHQQTPPPKESSPSPQPPPSQQPQQISQKAPPEEEESGGIALSSSPISVSPQPQPPGSNNNPLPTTQKTSPLVVVKSNIQFWEQRLNTTKPSQSQSASAAPDLVMGLPTQPQAQQQQQPQQQQPPTPPKFTDTSPSSSDESDSSSESANSSASSSPSTPTRVGGSSGAEVFAKQKNATLKKRTQAEVNLPGAGVSGGGTMGVVQTGSWGEHHRNVVPPPAMFTFSSTFNKPQVKVKPVVLSKPKLPSQFASGLNKMEEEEHDGANDNNGDDGGDENLSIEK